MLDRRYAVHLPPFKATSLLQLNLNGCKFFFVKKLQLIKVFPPLQSGREAVRLYMMALSGSTRERHFDLEQCLRFLESKNSEKHGLRLNPAVSRYQKFVINGPDSFLLLFQRSLRSHDVKKVLIYLRNFEILDETDCERISCESISDLMVTELVTMIRTKDPHAFWYFTHSLKKNALFQFFHGGIHCCGKSGQVT